MSEIKCPHCGSLVDYIPGEAELCPMCGGELKPPEAEASEQQKALSEGIRSLLTKVAEADRKIPDSPEGTNTAILDRTEKPVRPGAPPPPPPSSSRTNLPYLDADYNVNLFFIKGSSGVIRMHLIPHSDQLKGAVVFMETMAGAERIHREALVTETLQSGVPVEVRLSYCPEKVSGTAAFVFYIGCVLETETKYYQFSVEHMIYDPEPSTTQSQIIINENQTFQAREAGDIKYNSNLGDLVRGINSQTPTMHELLERLKNLQESFVRQSLRETTWRPEKGVVRGNPYLENRLTLEWNGNRILLFGGKRTMTLGRSSSCDLVVRTRGNGSLGPQDYPNNTVSRVHSELQYNGDSVQLFDKSRHGTFINNYNLAGGDVTLPDSADLEFGDIYWHMELQTCRMRQSHVICQTCVANPVRSLTFVRKDHEPECYLLVWQCCELGRLFPDLADWVVFFRDNAFFIRTPDQNFNYLRPGSAFNVNRQEIRIDYFH